MVKAERSRIHQAWLRVFGVSDKCEMAYSSGGYESPPISSQCQKSHVHKTNLPNTKKKKNIKKKNRHTKTNSDQIQQVNVTTSGEAAQRQFKVRLHLWNFSAVL